MKNLLLLLIVISSHAFSQKKVFTGKELNYAIELDSAVTYQRVEQQSVLSDVYFLKINDQLRYLITLASSPALKAGSSIYTEDFRKGFENTCTCTVLNSEKVKHKHLEGVRFRVKFVRKTQTLVGYVVGVDKAAGLFQIMILTPESSAGLVDEIYAEILDSLVINE